MRRPRRLILTLTLLALLLPLGPTRIAGALAAANDEGISSNTYTSTVGFAITWDAKVWRAELASRTEPSAGVVLRSDHSSVFVSFAGDATVAACAQAEAAGLDSFTGVSDINRVRDVAKPKSSSDASGLTYRFTLAAGGQSAAGIAYVECRPIVKQTNMTISVAMTLLTSETRYDQVRAQWTRLLAGITITPPAGA